MHPILQTSTWQKYCSERVMHYRIFFTRNTKLVEEVILPHNCAPSSQAPLEQCSLGFHNGSSFARRHSQPGRICGTSFEYFPCMAIIFAKPKYSNRNMNLGCKAKISNLDLHAVIEEHIVRLQVPYQKWFKDAFSKYFIWLQVVVHNKVIWSIWAIFIPVNDLVVMQILAAQQDLDINVEFKA